MLLGGSRDQGVASEGDELDDIMEEDEEVESEVSVRSQHQFQKFAR